MSQRRKKTNPDTVPAVGTTQDQSGGQEQVRTGPQSASAEDGTPTPPQPISRISKDDTTQKYWCGCEELTSPGRRWRPGHDSRGKGIIKRAVKEGKVGELPPQLREYGAERGMI